MASKFSISDAVRGVLARSTITADRVVLPPEQLDRKLYTDVNKALEGAGGKWDRKAKAHLFERDPREALGLAVATGEAVNMKQALQAFYTPDPLADRLVREAGLGRQPPGGWATVLEPSIGGGALAAAAIRATEGRLTITGYEVDPVAIKRASDRIVAEIARFNVPAAGLHVQTIDFLNVPAPPIGQRFDVVLMNPPFTSGADIRHVRHAWDFVAPGGRLAAIMSPSWQTARASAAKAFRAWVEEVGGWLQEIEAGAFKESGTDIATVMLIAARPA